MGFRLAGRRPAAGCAWVVIPIAIDSRETRRDELPRPRQAALDPNALSGGRFGPFSAGVLLPFPVYLGWLALASYLLDHQDTFGMVGDDALKLILGSAALVTASLGFAVVRSWKRRRFFAYGLLSSFGIFAVTGVGLALLLASAMKGGG